MMSGLALMMAISVAQLASGRADRVKIGPNEAIVTGDVKTLDHEILDEFGMNVQITARLRIKRVLKGKIAARSITVRYIAHMDLPEAKTLTFHLRRSDDGIYLVCSDGGRGYRCD